MNPGEKRLVLHHLLRGQVGKPVIHGGKNLGEFYGDPGGAIFRLRRPDTPGRASG